MNAHTPAVSVVVPTSVPARSGQWRQLSGNIAAEMVAAKASVTICSVLVDRTLFEQVGGFDDV